MNILEIKAAVRERDGHRCTQCGMTNEQHRARYGKGLHVHRLIPGSLYTLEGAVTLCQHCHGPQARRTLGKPDLGYPYERLEFQVPPGFVAALDEACHKRGLSRSAYVRQAALLLMQEDEKRN